MARVDEVIGYGTHADRPAAGSAGSLYYETDTTTLFRDNGTSWDELTLGGGGGGGAGTMLNATLSADVTPSDSTWTDILSLSLGAGTWDVTFDVQCRQPGSLPVAVKLWDGASELYAAATSGNTNSNTMSRRTKIELTGTTTIKLSGRNYASNTCVIRKTTDDITTGDVATQLNAVQVA